jgi:hypothetical protein
MTDAQRVLDNLKMSLAENLRHQEVLKENEEDLRLFL